MASNQFTTSEKETIVEAIKKAELHTSGEVRVHIEQTCKQDPLLRAEDLFLQLKMDNTALRNGVLFYVALKDHKFAICGDKGIDDVTPDDFWEDIKAHMLNHLKQGNVVAALSEGIEMAGHALKEHFPYEDDDVNELSDDISFGEEDS